MAREKSRRGGTTKAAQSRKELREKTREVYREAILDAAERVFARKGFAGSRMADIAEAAGVATGTLYNYFPSKGDVFTALVGLLGQRFVDRARVTLAPVSDPLERLVQVIRFTFQYLEEHQTTWALFGELGAVTESDLGRVAGAEVERRYADWIAIIERVIADAQAAGLVRPDLPSELQVAFLTGTINGFCRFWVTGSAPTGQLVAKTDLVLTLFLRGVGTQS